MKPDWSSPAVPEWAAYAAQQITGTWEWHECKPVYVEICSEWQSKGRTKVIPKVEFRPQETLEARPHVQQE